MAAKEFLKIIKKRCYLNNLVYKNFVNLLFIILFSSVYLSVYAQPLKQDKEEKEGNKYNFSSDFLLNQKFKLIKNIKSGKIEEVSPKELEKIFGLANLDFTNEEDRKDLKFIMRYGSYGITNNGWDFSYNVYHDKKTKYFIIYLEPLSKEQASTCKISYLDFSKKLLSLGFEERKSYGSILDVPGISGNEDRIGELFSTYFIDKRNKGIIETVPLKYNISNVECVYSVEFRVP